jgi:phage terminase large subunit-like protein
VEIRSHEVPASRRGTSRKLALKSEVYIRWIEDYCRVPEAMSLGKKVVLREWQRDCIRKIYDNDAGCRQAILSFGRKNGKTALSAFLLLLHLCGPAAQANSQLYSTAKSREQAAVLFEMAAKIVRLSPELSEYVTIRDTAKQLVCAGRGTIYRALSAEASTAFGLSPIFVVHDELGQVRGERSALFEAIETATAAHESTLSIIISTQAPTDNDLLSRLIDEVQTGEDQTKVCVLYTADEMADPFAEDTIRQANPAFGDFQNAKKVLDMAADAKAMPSREAEYRNYVLNQRVEASSPFVSRSLWESCGGPVLPLHGVPVYAGLDLSAVNDLTALVLVGKVHDKWHVHPTFWLPGDGLADKSRKDRVPYDMWAKQGHLKAAPGKSIDYTFVAAHLLAIFDQYDIRRVAFDRWGMEHLAPLLIEAGFTEQMLEERFVKFGQGYQSMSPALRDLESEILNGRIVHGGHPVLTMCVQNAVVQMDPSGNRKLTKAKSAGRIDGAVSLAMAMGVAATAQPQPKYQIHIF